MMESIKELARGLMGFHVLDEKSKLYSEPSNVRKFIGIILNLYILLPILLVIPVAVAMFFMAVINGIWGFAVGILLFAPIAMGMQSIMGWIIIDWDKNRVQTKLKNTRP